MAELPKGINPYGVLGCFFAVLLQYLGIEEIVSSIPNIGMPRMHCGINRLTKPHQQREMKMKKAIQTVFILCLSTLLLSACSGGGSSSSTSSPASFVKWSSVTPPATVTIDGVSQDATYVAVPGELTIISDQGVSTSSSATIKYREDGTIELIEIKTPTTSMVWDEFSGDFIEEDSGIVFASDPPESNIGFLINSTDPNLNWDYQTFGVWVTGWDTENGTVGAMSVGAPTIGSAIPTTGNVTFTGITSGLYVDTEGTTSYFTASPLIVGADFLNRELSLATVGTLKTNRETEVTTAASNLDMTGTLHYASGTNSFTGNVSATGLTGSSSGRFYGPNAEELGGVFGLSGEGVESYLGGYGAKR